MRYAIFSDVHANLRAWERALADIRGQQVDVLVCLGDVVGYGPKPEEVLQGIRAVTENFVMGNHDAAAAGAMDYSIFNEQARHSIEWTTQALSAESREFLGAVPLAIAAEDILFVHAEISEPGRFAYIDCPETAAENLADSDHFVTFVGHTHHPNIYQRTAAGSVEELPGKNQRLDSSNRYIVNVGSVGEPRDPDDLRGVYVIYDSETREVIFRKVAFDIEGYRNELQSTSLQVTPFFLQSYDYKISAAQVSAPSVASALAMEAPASVKPLIRKRRRPVGIHVRNVPLSVRDRDPRAAASATESQDSERSRTRRPVALFTLVGILVVGMTVWGVRHFGGSDSPGDPLNITDATRVGSAENGGLVAGDEIAPVPPNDSEPIPKADSKPGSESVKPVEVAAAAPSTSPPNPGAGPEPGAPPSPDTPKPKPGPAPASAPTAVRAPDPTVAWWRMEPDSLGGELIDTAEKHSLPAVVPGTEIGGLAPPVIPANGAENHAALGLGVWIEAEPENVFELRADRSFTFEGWLLTDKPRSPIFVAGTRSGETNDSQGWHIDIRPPTKEFPNGQMCFFYDSGPEILQALSKDVVISDLKPHHFAAVWDHDASAKAGEMRLLLDGEQIAATKVPHAIIPAAQANAFRIGAATNPPRIGVDEVRFSRAALGSHRLLNTRPGTVLLAEGFETPDVTGFKKGSAPPGWIGSSVGSGSGQWGVIDGRQGAVFTTPQGWQAFSVGNNNSGLTSGQAAVRELLTAGNTYRVGFNVGAKKGETTSYHVELVAFEPKHNDAARRDLRKERPGVVLAQATGETTANDLSQTDSIVFTPDSTNPHLGKAIGIRLVNAKGNALYDDIELISQSDPLSSPAAIATVAAAPTPKSPLPAPKTPPKPASPPAPKPKGDPTVAWWRMEADSVGTTLVDSKKKHPLPATTPGIPIGGLAPSKIPANGISNAAALGIGVWTEPAPADVFGLRSDRSFTLEGWVLTAKPRVPIFIAGTRSGEANDSQGWHVDIRPPSNQFPNGQMAFFYDNGPEFLEALSEDVSVGNLSAHHFAAVWDHDAAKAAGEMRLYLDGDQIAGTEVPYPKLLAAQANPFRIGAATNPPKIGLDEVRFSHAALGPLEFLGTETQSMSKSGKWTDAANWSAGEPPSGSQTAVVGAGIVAQVAEAPPEYRGDLVLKEAAKLTVTEKAFAVMPNPPAKLLLHQGAELIVMTANNAGGNKGFGRIELAGNATIWGGRSTSGHHTRRVFSGEISGPGALVFEGVNNNEFVLGVANTFQGGFLARTTQNQGFHVRATAAGSLGEGNVEIAANVSLMLDAAQAIAPQTTLTLTGAKDSRSPAKVVLNAANTVAGLVFDGKKQAPGTWGAPGSGVDHEHANFSGSEILTVKQ